MRHEWGGISPSPSLRNSWVQPGAGLVPMTPSLGPSVGVGYPVLGGISLSVIRQHVLPSGRRGP
jgi:hypothetical protein